MSRSSTSAPGRTQSRATQSQSQSQSQVGQNHYDSGDFYDEMFLPEGTPRPSCEPLYERIRHLPPDELIRRQKASDRSMMRLGIT